MSHIFISHATKDDRLVKELREQLEGLNLSVWVDSRQLRGGSKLEPEIEGALRNARQVIVVLSPNTVNSPWVRKEIKIALEVEQAGEKKDYRVIALLLEGIEPEALELWFDEEPLAVPIELKVGGLSEAMQAILAALGERLPEDYQPLQEIESPPVEELVLELVDPKFSTRGGKRRVTATATLVYEPADESNRRIKTIVSPSSRRLAPSKSKNFVGILKATLCGQRGSLKNVPITLNPNSRCGVEISIKRH